MDVPEQLANELIEAGESHADDLPGLHYRMAFCIIRFYLGEDWADQKVRLQHEFDPFMLNEFDEESDNRFTHQNRVEGLGDALFRLRNCSNFDVLCGRFRSRETKPCFTETQIANLVANSGFQVEIVEETGVRGADFDFIAHGACEDISIEVTAKEPVPLTVATIRNTLQSKRDQVPADRAAILYIIIPEDWTEDANLAESIFSEAFENFFNGSRRFNAVVLVWVAALDIGEGRAFALTFRPYENKAPRHPIDDTSFLHDEHPIGDLNTVRERVNNDSVKLKKELEETFSAPHASFYDWYLHHKT
jgi:hypothetical protein